MLRHVFGNFDQRNSENFAIFQDFKHDTIACEREAGGDDHDITSADKHKEKATIVDSLPLPAQSTTHTFLLLNPPNETLNFTP